MLEGNARLGISARAVLSDPGSRLLVPVVALAETCWVVSKGRTSLSDWRLVLTAVNSDSRIGVASMDQNIVARAMLLPASLEMHDAQIVATALTRSDEGHDARLLTCDAAIVSTGLVPIVW
jgi:predicted nucleic acid-binding protein